MPEGYWNSFLQVVDVTAMNAGRHNVGIYHQVGVSYIGYERVLLKNTQKIILLGVLESLIKYQYVSSQGHLTLSHKNVFFNGYYFINVKFNRLYQL